MANKTIAITPENWQSEVMSSDIPVLVDFWAEWCYPCKAIGPILEELSEELDGKMKIAKVNVDQNRALAGQYFIQSIPTLLVIRDGAVAEQMVGAMSKAAMLKKLQPFL